MPKLDEMLCGAAGPVFIVAVDTGDGRKFETIINQHQGEFALNHGVDEAGRNIRPGQIIASIRFSRTKRKSAGRLRLSSVSASKAM